MDENMNTNTQETQPENMGNAESTGKSDKPKMFTQEEVNSFVQSRISRMRGQIEKESKAQYDQKLAELQEREMKLLAREELDKRGMSRDLADIITCADEKELNSKLDLLEKIYGGSATANKQNDLVGFRQVGAGSSDNPGNAPDPVREAMGLKRS